MTPSTLFDKIWAAHEVAPGLIYIDLHLVHEVTSPQAFDGLRLAGRPVRRPDRTLATADHNVPTDGTPVAARIAGGLDLRLSQLLRLEEAGSVTIVRADERRRGGSARGGHRVEVLTAPLPGQRAELSRHVLAPGSRTGLAGDPPMHEPGSREIALVEDGAVVLEVDGERHDLAAGDCVTFDADLPHHFANPGKEEAVLLAIVSAGLRRS